MKSYKEFKQQIEESSRKVKTKVSSAAMDRLAQQMGQSIGTGSSSANLPAVVSRPQNLPTQTVSTPQTTNLPATTNQTAPKPQNVSTTEPKTTTTSSTRVVPKTKTSGVLNKLSKIGRAGNIASLALTPSELGNAEEDPEYQKQMRKHREANPTSSMGPKQRTRYLQNNKPLEGDYIPKQNPGTEVSAKTKTGQTIDVNPETKKQTSTSLERINKLKVDRDQREKRAQELKQKAQTKTDTKTKVQVAPPPPKGGMGGKPPAGGKPPFAGPPAGGGPNAAPKPFAAVDPNKDGGFVTAGVSKGPNGELRTVNVSRGKVDSLATPHKNTGLDTPLQKAKNVDYVKPQDWKQASSKEVTGVKLPPQGTKQRDDTLEKMGYKKF